MVGNTSSPDHPPRGTQKSHIPGSAGYRWQQMQTETCPSTASRRSGGPHEVRHAGFEMEPVFRGSDSGKRLQDGDQQRTYKFAPLRPHLLEMNPEMMFLGVVLFPIPVGRLISHRLYPAGETAGIAVTRAENACSFPPAENRGPLHVEHRALYRRQCPVGFPQVGAALRPCISDEK